MKFRNFPRFDNSKDKVKAYLVNTKARDFHKTKVRDFSLNGLRIETEQKGFHNNFDAIYLSFDGKKEIIKVDILRANLIKDNCYSVGLKLIFSAGETFSTWFEFIKKENKTLELRTPHKDSAILKFTSHKSN